MKNPHKSKPAVTCILKMAVISLFAHSTAYALRTHNPLSLFASGKQHLPSSLCPHAQLQALNDKCQQLSFKETLERNARIQVYVCTDGHV